MEKVSRIIFADPNEDFRLLMADAAEDEDGVEEYRDVRVSEIYLFGVEA